MLAKLAIEKKCVPSSCVYFMHMHTPIIKGNTHSHVCITSRAAEFYYVGPNINETTIWVVFVADCGSNRNNKKKNDTNIIILEYRFGIRRLKTSYTGQYTILNGKLLKSKKVSEYNDIESCLTHTFAPAVFKFEMLMLISSDMPLSPFLNEPCI